jgi:hypothetical protein
MKSAYRVLAFIIAAMVAFQSAVIVFAIFGLFAWVEQGGVIDAAAQQTASFPGDVGFMLHGIGGMMVIPVLGLLLLIFSFFAKIPGGVKWALIVFGTIVLQVLMGMFAHGAPGLGLLHGLIALVLFGVAVTAGMRVRRATATPARAAADGPAPVVQ